MMRRRILTGLAASMLVLTEPGSGIGPVYRLISGARSSIDLTMYELADPVAEADLAAAAGRGVDAGEMPGLAERLRARLAAAAAAGGLPDGRLAEAFQVLDTA